MLLAFVAGSNKCSGHGLLDFVTTVDFVVLGMLLARYWYVRDRLATTTANFLTFWIGTTKLKVFLDRGQNSLVVAERAFL